MEYNKTPLKMLSHRKHDYYVLIVWLEPTYPTWLTCVSRLCARFVSPFHRVRLQSNTQKCTYKSFYFFPVSPSHCIRGFQLALHLFPQLNSHKNVANKNNFPFENMEFCRMPTNKDCAHIVL